MTSLSKKQNFLFDKFYIPACLFLVSFLAYGLLIPNLGFYWDDMPISWIYYQRGSDALTEYFSNNRPIWGILFQLTGRIFPQQPIYWQIFALLLRWLSAVLLYKLLYQLVSPVAFSSSLLFLVYPGFDGHWAAYLFSHFYIVLCFFIASLLLMLRQKRLYSVAALFLSAMNLWMLEYFFVLELIRPLILWQSIAKQTVTVREGLRRLFGIWYPYFVVFVMAVVSRVLIFNNQTYKVKSFQQILFELTTSPTSVISSVIWDLWYTSAVAWGRIFRIRRLAAADNFEIALFILIFVISSGSVAYSYARQPATDTINCRRNVILLGIVALPLAGVPFWFTGIPISLSFPANRATLPFMFGVSMLMAGILHFIPMKPRSVILALVIGLASANHFLSAEAYARDWENYKRFFLQMTWRVPALRPGTTVLLNDRSLYFEEKNNTLDLVDRRVLPFYADNSMVSTLNWIYAPAMQENEVLHYVLFYPKSRFGGSLQKLEAEVSITYEYYDGLSFAGNTSQIVAFSYAPPGCLRMLDPEIDSQNQLLQSGSLLRDVAGLSSSRWVEFNSEPSLPEIYRVRAEPDNEWCFYFEQAELARQQEDWEHVVALGEKAFSLNGIQIAPLERFVFIEGYAHVGKWHKAFELSMEETVVSKSIMEPLLCKLWDRIDANTEDNLEKDSILLNVRTNFHCTE